VNLSAAAVLEQGLTWLARAGCEAAVLAAAVFLVTLALGKRLPARWRFALWLVVFVRLALPITPAAPWSVFRLPVSPSSSTAPASTTFSRQPDVAVSEPNITAQ
jgi:beta-lactamase regulating signal transducer with metallopeptidase domain